MPDGSIWKAKALILALVIILLTAMLTCVVNRNPTSLYRSDLYVRWYAVDKLFSTGRGLYDSENGKEVMRAVWGDGRGWTLNFYYPAHVLLFIGPLALLPYPIAHLLWTLAGQLFYLGGLWIVIRLVGWPRSLRGVVLFSICSLGFLPYLQHTVWGQFNTIGILGLALCYHALCQERYALAGVWLVGLTFKPHTTALTLAFLLGWALFRRDRWHLLLGFGLAGLGLWALGESFEPGWVASVARVAGEYGTAKSVIDEVWNPYQLVALALSVVAIVAFVRNGQVSATSPAFRGCLALSLSVWSVIVPVIGMVHVVAMPLAVVLLLSSLRQRYPFLYRWGLFGISAVYVLGILSVFLAMLGVDGQTPQAFWDDSVYDGTLLPILVSLLSLPLCFRSASSEVDPVLAEADSTPESQ